jgi:hypothetical protein
MDLSADEILKLKELLKDTDSEEVPQVGPLADAEYISDFL